MAYFRTTPQNPLLDPQDKMQKRDTDTFQYSYDVDSMVAAQLRNTDPPPLEMRPLITPSREKSVWRSRDWVRTACVTFAAVAVCLLLVGFIVYMIPREPTVEFRRGEIVLEEAGSITVIETIRLNNPNWQHCEFDDFELDLFQGATFVSHTKDTKRNTVGPREVESVKIRFHLQLTEEQDSMIRTRCATTQGVSFTLDGVAKAKTWSSDFGKIDVGSWTDILFCGNPDED